MSVRIGPSVQPGALPLLLLDDALLPLLDEPPLLLEEEPPLELEEEDPPEELDPPPLPDPLAPLLPDDDEPLLPDDDDVPLLPEEPEDEPVPDELPDEPVLDEPPDDPVPDEPPDEPVPESGSIPTNVVPPQASRVTSASVAGAHFRISPRRSMVSSKAVARLWPDSRANSQENRLYDFLASGRVAGHKRAGDGRAGAERRQIRSRGRAGSRRRRSSTSRMTVVV
jgi:hypothetical protein